MNTMGGPRLVNQRLVAPGLIGCQSWNQDSFRHAGAELDFGRVRRINHYAISAETIHSQFSRRPEAPRIDQSFIMSVRPFGQNRNRLEMSRYRPGRPHPCKIVVIPSSNFNRSIIT